MNNPSNCKMWATKQLGHLDSSASLLRDARDFSLINGLVLRFREKNNYNCTHHVPVTLFPSPFPRRLYEDCLELQPVVSELMWKIATDYGFLHKTLEKVSQVDDFTRNLLNISSIIQKEGHSQSIISCINRSDYMLHGSLRSLELRQVETNAISSAMAYFSSKTTEMHHYLLEKHQVCGPQNSYLPKNESLQCVTQGIIDAFDAYGKADTFVLFIIEGRSVNFSDQFAIELAVYRVRPDIRFIRKSFDSLPNTCSLGPNKELILEENREVALVYFRYGYDPSNYNFDGAWDLRLLLERSRAIKCPSINFHLSGAKKFQHVLNSSEQLERYLNSDEAKRLAKTFCKIWSIEDSPAGNEGYQIGLDSSKNLVLKPQREGGGHNIYSTDIKPFLQGITDPSQRSQYILMEYIDSPLEKNCLLLFDDATEDPDRWNNFDKLVSELGIYGSIIADNSSVRSNKCAGYLVRSKKFGVNEGGVSSGFAGVSSLILMDDTLDDFDSSVYFHN